MKKRILTVLLALTLVFSMGAPALANDLTAEVVQYYYVDTYSSGYDFSSNVDRDTGDVNKATLMQLEDMLDAAVEGDTDTVELITRNAKHMPARLAKDLNKMADEAGVEVTIRNEIHNENYRQFVYKSLSDIVDGVNNMEIMVKSRDINSILAEEFTDGHGFFKVAFEIDGGDTMTNNLTGTSSNQVSFSVVSAGNGSYEDETTTEGGTYVNLIRVIKDVYESLDMDTVTDATAPTEEGAEVDQVVNVAEMIINSIVDRY